MVDLRNSEIRLIKDFVSYPEGAGYVLNFSNRTFAEFFEGEFSIDIDEKCYEALGKSKGNRLLSFCSQEPAALVTKVLRRLLEERQSISRSVGGAVINHPAKKFEELIVKIETGADQPKTDALDRYEVNETLDELVRDLERTIADNKPEAALDHLHTYCMRKFAYLLSVRGVACTKEEALHSRFGKYRKELIKEKQFQKITDISLKSAISIFAEFNDVRNNHSLAHDNPILNHSEARYIFDAITALLRFVKAIEAGKYEQVSLL